MSRRAYSTVGSGSEPRPWPAAPIAKLVDGYSIRAIQATLGCGHTSWLTALRLGLTDSQADRWAVALGRHPAELWGGWATYGLEAA